MNTFFIAGAQRSGTTLLSVMLSKHSDIYIDGNSIGFRFISCFKYFEKVLPYNLNYSKDEILSWLIEIDYKGRLNDLLQYEDIGKFSDVKELIRHGIEQKLHKENKKLFGDKSPNIEHFVADLKLLIPEAKFIHVVRDGRAAALSKHKRAHKNLYLAGQEWVDSNIAGLANQALIGKESYKMVRYEDILLNPASEIKEICQFLDIAYDAKTISKSENQNDEKSYVKSTLDTNKIDAYKTKLTANQIKKIEKIQGPLLQKFNYELINSPHSGKHKQLSVLTRIFYNQLDNVNQLFISKRMGMVNRKNVEIEIPFNTRLKSFIFQIGKDFLPDKVFMRIFRRRWVRNVYFNGNVSGQSKK